MGKIKDLIIEGIKKEGWHFTEPEEEALVLSFTGNSDEEVLTMYILITEGDSINGITFYGGSNQSFAGKEIEGYSIANTLTEKYKWCAFYLLADKILTMKMSAMLNPDNILESFKRYLFSFVTIYWDAYPLIKDALKY